MSLAADQFAARPRARHYRRGVIPVLELTGEFDLASREWLRDELWSTLGPEPPALIVDVDRVEFCDLDCARMIVCAHRRTRLVLTGAHGVVLRMFSLLDPGEVLPRCASLDNAVRRLGEAPPERPR